MELVQRGGNEATLRRSGYQPDDSWTLWGSLIGEACHADSVTYAPWVNLRRRVLGYEDLYEFNFSMEFADQTARNLKCQQNLHAV